MSAGRINTGIPHFTLMPTDNPNALKKMLIRASVVKKSELNAITKKYKQFDHDRIDAYNEKVKGHVCSPEKAP